MEKDVIKKQPLRYQVFGHPDHISALEEDLVGEASDVHTATSVAIASQLRFTTIVDRWNPTDVTMISRNEK